MKKAKITYIPIDGTGVLHLDFQQGPFADATEARKGDGIGFFSASGELQGVTFDDVDQEKDQQVLEFERYRIEASVNKGKISYAVIPLDGKTSRSQKRRAKDAA